MKSDSSMNGLPYSVIIFDTDGKITSRCCFPTGRAARKRYEKAIVSADCANVGSVHLVHTVERGFDLDPHLIRISTWVRPVLKLDVQTAGYIVHSVHALDAGVQTPLGHKIFHDNVDDAVRQAHKLADEWHLGHEGLIVFKAVKHVKKVERPDLHITTKIQVRDV